MVQLEELDADAPPPDLEEIPGAELSARILACDGLWLASELALQEGGLLTGKGVNHLCVFGAIPTFLGWKRSTRSVATRTFARKTARSSPIFENVATSSGKRSRGMDRWRS